MTCFGGGRIGVILLPRFVDPRVYQKSRDMFCRISLEKCYEENYCDMYVVRLCVGRVYRDDEKGDKEVKMGGI
jgi:hypothetical protein